MTIDVRLAREGDREIIIGLIDEASQWLATKDTDQWAKPWPCQEIRDRRIEIGITLGATWLLCDGEAPAGTVTVYDQDRAGFWHEQTPGFEALYVHRLVVARRFAARGLGSWILDRVAGTAARSGVPEIRIDVWTDNHALHRYYRDRGFGYVRTVSVDEVEALGLDGRPYTDVPYPSRALFRRRCAGLPSSQDSAVPAANFLDE